MKKLGKKSIEQEQTIEAFTCNCGCGWCGCSCNGKDQTYSYSVFVSGAVQGVASMYSNVSAVQSM